MKLTAKHMLQRYLAGEATVDDQQALFKMIDSEGGRRRFSELMDEELAEIERAENHVSQDVIDKVYAAINRKIRRRALRRRWLQAAAVIVPLLAFAWLAHVLDVRFALFSPTEYAEIMVEKGSCMQVAFHDGSQVILCSGSRMRYPEHFAYGERRVEIDGEGYFKIKKDRNRPFIISSPHGDVRVTGTEFDFESYTNTPVVKVTLFDGAIEFQGAESCCALRPGEQLAYNTETHETVVSELATLSKITAWRHNLLVFNRATLRELAAKLSQWYDAEFIITDPSLASHTFTYTTERKPLNEILAELEFISPLRFTLQADTVRILAK